MNDRREVERIGQRILLVGGNSAIGEAIARRLASPNRRVLITGRVESRLDATRADLLVKGYAQVEVACFDPSDVNSAPQDLLSSATEILGGLDTLIWAVGSLPDEATEVNELSSVERTMRVNASAAVVMMSLAAHQFLQQGKGQIVAIGSVAGDRGRATNALYGAAKNALATFMSGLDQEMQGRGVHVLCVKPGLVDTPMTAAFSKGPVWSCPAGVASDVERAMKKKRSIVYTPWYWAPIMLVVRLLPKAIFRRLRF
jgi:hypothetical protein